MFFFIFIFLFPYMAFVSLVRGTLPDPIFTSPLCWINIVSQVRFPWMMGGEHECK